MRELRSFSRAQYSEKAELQHNHPKKISKSFPRMLGLVLKNNTRHQCRRPCSLIIQLLLPLWFFALLAMLRMTTKGVPMGEVSEVVD